VSIFTRPIRHEPMSSDEAVRRYVEAVRREIEPDPMFRRRLRGTVVNRFVAEREGTARPIVRPSRMGRLGRACLYASLATALSVGGVMAASETAVPGEFLYPLKRSIEEMRMEVAPAHLRDDLAVHILAERIDELGTLVASGSYDRAADLAGEVRRTVDELAAAGGGAIADERIATQMARLDEALDHAPARTRAAIERAMGGAPGLIEDPANGRGNAHGGGDGQSPSRGNGNASGPGAADRPDDDPPGQVGRSPRPEPSPKPDPSADAEAPDRTAKPDRTENPDPTAKPDRAPKPDRTPKPEPTPEPSTSPEAEEP
jgi:Domain of unknown function (DUF5667)